MAMESPEEEVESTTVSFSPPPGFKQPDDVRDGEAFEVVAKCKMVDGQVQIESVNGIALGGEPEEEMEVEEIEEETAEDDEPMSLMAAARETGY